MARILFSMCGGCSRSRKKGIIRGSVEKVKVHWRSSMRMLVGERGGLGARTERSDGAGFVLLC